jgi:hypothetical protein
MMNKNEREQMEKLQAEAAATAERMHLISSNYASEKAAQSALVESLNKEVSQQKSYVEMYRSSSAKAENELEAAHSLLDGLPQAPPREQNDNKSSYAKTVPLATRLASWVARVAFCDAFAKAGMK